MVRKTLQTTIFATMMISSTACAKKVVETTISPAPGSATSAQLAKPLDGQVGAANGRAAVEAFLLAVKTQDLRGMSAVWGNDKGPMADRIKRDELEKRLIVIQCLLTHDKWQFAEERARLVTGGRQQYIVALQQHTIRGQTTFTAVEGPGGRWFVEDIKLDVLKDFCR